MANTVNTPGLMQSLPRAPSPAGDLDVVTRCRQGDTGAWRALYDQYAPMVHRFLSAFGSRPTNEKTPVRKPSPFTGAWEGSGARRGCRPGFIASPPRHASRASRRRRVRKLLSTFLVARAPATAGPGCRRSDGAAPPAGPDAGQAVAQKAERCWCCSRSKACPSTRWRGWRDVRRTRPGRGCTTRGPNWQPWRSGGRDEPDSRVA